MPSGILAMITYRDQFGHGQEWQSFPLNGCIHNLRPCAIGSAAIPDKETTA